MSLSRTNAARLQAERRAEITLVQLLCAASMARTALTRILPLAGGPAWWIAVLCLLPGLAVAGVFRLAMHRTGAATLTEALRAALGRFGGWAISLVLGALLLIDGVSSITALITLFTEGIGTRGTQFTLALLTSAVLLCCLHREGLPRGVYLLRWPVYIAVAVLMAFALPDVRLDGLHPFLGEGEASLRAAVMAGASLAWPLTLLLTIGPGSKPSRAASALSPCLWTVGLLLLLALTIPHEAQRHASLAQALLQPVHFLPTAVRTLGQCLLMLVLFLAVAASALLATGQLCAPVGASPQWLPYAIAVLLTLTQAGPVDRLWAWLGRIEPWLLCPLAALALLSLTAACLRRKRG